ncbi:MAG TPA: hypothetical protein VFI10_02870, partial [Gaiellaceae bacterium]|nr:hypothetical protein [Gaiellaceae bacterium]
MLMLVLGLVAAAGAAFALMLHPGRAADRSLPTFVSSALGAQRPTAARPPAALGARARLTRDGATLAGSGAAVSLAPADSGTGAWRHFEHGAVRPTPFGREAVTLAPGSFEQFTTVDRHLGQRIWRWHLSTLDLSPRLREDGSVAFTRDGRPAGPHILPVAVFDEAGRDVTPSGAHWSLARAGHAWQLRLELDDASLPVPYTIDPSVSTVTFTGAPQTAGATADWTIGFTTSNPGGALAAGDTITVTFNAAFTVPASPTVTLGAAFSSCSASASATGSVVTITLSGASCSLAKKTAADLQIAGITNPAAATYTGSTFGVATSADTTAASPSNVVIAAGSQVTAPTFSGAPQTAAARSTWTVGFNVSAAGALNAGSTITVVFPGTFTVPATPAVTLTGAYVNCAATAAAAGSTVTVTLADSGGTCALANSASGALKLSFLTNPAAGSIAAASWSVKTSQDTSARNPAAAISIAAATAPSAISFSGSPQTGTARSTWTVGFTTSASGALAAGDTITAVFNAGFTVPATPTVQLTGGFTNCAATGTAAGTTVTITLSDSGGACAVGNSSAATLKVVGLTNPAASTLTNTTFTVKTSRDTATASPGANVVIAAPTKVTAVSFSGAPQTGGALSTWTVGFTSTSTGALAAGDTLTIVFNSGFTVPATPGVTLTSGFSNCTASAAAAAQTVTVTLSGASCALASTTAAALKLSGLTNPGAGSLLNTTFSVKTSTDTVVSNPAANVTVNAATSPSSVTFAASTRAAAAAATWTVGFTASPSGALDAADTITVVFPAGFTIPASPTITLPSGFANCSATATGSGTTVTIDINDNAGTCALAASAAGSLTIAGVTNPAAGTYAASGFTVKTTRDAAAASPAAAIDIFGAASKLAFTTSPSPATAGVAFATQPVVAVEDSGGRIVANDNSTQVTLAITSAGGTEGFSCTTNPVTVVSGVATFSGCAVNKAGTYTLDATKAGLTTGTSSSFTISAAAADHLSFTQQPSAANAGASLGTVKVAILDQYGNQTSSTANVTLAIKSGTGDPAATLSGTATVA